ncbi:MAG TPA: META domain-containing protein [Gemmatimonadales bacterium]|nr:META domain-containing protein [Gemmatimonadales bacterium]
MTDTSPVLQRHFLPPRLVPEQFTPGHSIARTLLRGRGVRDVQPAPEAREEAVPGAEVSPSPQAGLEGTSWRLVKFQGGDETILRPEAPARYTIAFERNGGLSARIDCNRGRGTWRSSGPPGLEFGPLALTRAMCPPGSLHDHVVRQWPYVRSYVIEDGVLTGGERGEVELMLRRVGDAPVTAASRQPELHLILNSVTRRASGSGGCNRVAGSYELSGDRLRLGRMAGTLMACMEGMETEQAFLEMLGRVSGWRMGRSTP